MTGEAMAILHFLDHRKGIHYTEQGISVCMHERDNFCVSCKMPGPVPASGKYSLELDISFICITQLMQKLNIRTAQDLENVLPELLLELYERGDATACCLLNDSSCFGLRFRKLRSSFFVTDMFLEHTHSIAAAFQTPEDFYDYTVYFYENVYRKQYK